MIIIENNIIPFGGCKCINLFGILFTKSELDDEDKNHEGIHSILIIDCIIMFAALIGLLVIIAGVNPLWLFAAIPSYYIYYVIEWLVRLALGSSNAYKEISFELEAYNNESNLSYSKHFGWFKYY